MKTDFKKGNEMPIPIHVEELFQLNPNSKVTYHDDWVCIDDITMIGYV